MKRMAATAFSSYAIVEKRTSFSSSQTVALEQWVLGTKSVAMEGFFTSGLMTRRLTVYSQLCVPVFGLVCVLRIWLRIASRIDSSVEVMVLSTAGAMSLSVVEAMMLW
jgi:hypothetical protein